jgi:hypothetical protein
MDANARRGPRLTIEPHQPWSPINPCSHLLLCSPALAPIFAWQGKSARLKPFELPVKCVLEGKINTLLQGFSIENDCLTPTFKLKRPQLLKRYQQQIDGMYAQLGHQPGPTGGERASALPRISVGGQGDGKCTPQQQNTARSFFSLSTNRTPRFGGKEDVWAV